MRIAFVADGRSPIALRWLESVKALGHEVVLITSYPCKKPPMVDEFHFLPIGMSNIAAQGKKQASTGWKKQLLRTFRGFFQNIRYFFGPSTVQSQRKNYLDLIYRIKPDLVHALRIPYEGMLASFTPLTIPLAVSIWGNDLTLHALKSKNMLAWTNRVLDRANGLHADAARDINLAQEWRFDKAKPTLLAPTNGGIDLTGLQENRLPLSAVVVERIPPDHFLVINPRGIRSYTRTDTFFKAIPLVLKNRPKTAFLCPGMEGEAEADRWAKTINADERVVLLPPLPQGELWELFGYCPVSVSVTEHDGTPNTLLEAMSMGSFPVAGKIPSILEWIENEQNGLLIPPGSPEQLAAAIIEAIDNEGLRARAREYNFKLVAEKADTAVVRPRIDNFYTSVARLTALMEEDGEE